MLGPFEVRTDDGILADVPGARLRGLLIALALEPGHAVPKATLIDWIWGEHPPSEAANALQRLVSRLRKALPEGLVEGQTDGYRLTVEPDTVDAVRFERLIGQARNDGDPRRVRLLREGLALWRGAAMQGVGLQDSAAFDAAVTRLEGLRLAAMEDRFDAEISLGHGAELVTELTDLVAAHLVRERLVAALMRALVATGRDSEALLVYQRTREALAGALGVDPSPELSALHVALLRGELGRRERCWLEEGRKTNLRAELTSFVGKDADVAAVRELIAQHRLTTRMRSQQAQLYWLLGDEDSSTAAIAEAQRCAERVTWPDALAELALAKAELARWGGNAEEAYQQLGVARTMLGDEAERADIRAVTHDLLGYLADDLSEAREHRVAACQAASEAGHAPQIAKVLVGVADLALRCDQYEQAARLLAASAAVRGLPDRSHPDVARIEQAARRRLGEARFAEATQEGAQASWRELAGATLAC